MALDKPEIVIAGAGGMGALFGAILHDIGKLVVPKRILGKEGPFTPEEWDIMRQHPVVGAKMIEGVDHLKPATPYILCHHEKWDGSGYPHGLQGKNIPIEGRVMALADVYDAVTSDRAYHKGLSKESALKNGDTSFGKNLMRSFPKQKLLLCD